LAGLLLSLCLVAPSHARLIPLRTFEELVRDSDVVAIVRPVATARAGDASYEADPQLDDRERFRAWETRLRVELLLKGEPASELTLLHFAYTDEPGIVINGAAFVSFEASAENTRPGEDAVWLAFLRQMPEGRVEPVTGQYDSADSFRRILQAD